MTTRRWESLSTSSSDARQKTVTLFSEPSNDRYRMREDVDFGELVHIPVPFSFTLDTSLLHPY
ncbi:hypothetical protein [Streptomyces blastmyceticus]|uniref:Uncharacterized protein n=1 Tax=Streptomyces blastmyceticus TaxID=68180 RepID=A0ABP3HTR0_9ACTN